MTDGAGSRRARLAARWRAQPDDGRRFWTWALVGTLLALGLRVAWVAWAARQPAALYDPSRYLGYAKQIADGNGMIEPLSGHPTAYYPPGYPWFLGIVVWFAKPFTGNYPLVAGMVQAVLGAATATLAGVVARRLAGVRAGIVAVFVLAVYPNLIAHTGALLGETLYDLLFLAFLAVLLARPWDEALSLRRVAAAGVLLGLAVMVRPISLAVVPVVVLAWWASRRDLRQVGRWSVVLLLAVGACIVPWTIRNAVRMDAFVPISTNTGDNLCLGHGDGATGAFTVRDQCDVPYNLLDGPSAEVAADKAKTRIAKDAILDDPGREPWLTWRRFYFTWIRSGDHDGTAAVQSYRFDRWIAVDTETRLFKVSDLAYYAVAVTGLVGSLALLRRRRPGDLLVVGSAIMTAAVPLAFFGDSRFKVPVIPLLIIAAAALAGGSWRADAEADAEPEPDPVP